MSSAASSTKQSPIHGTAVLRDIHGSVTPAPAQAVEALRTINDDDLLALATHALDALHHRGLTHHLPVAPAMLFSPPAQFPSRPFMPAPRQPDMWENAKIEKIICAGLSPPYDGSSNTLIPTLNRIHIQRKNEVWYPALFLSQDNVNVDIVLQFSKLTTEAVTAQAKKLWDAPDASIQSHTRGSDTYNARLLGLFLMNSLTPDFAAMLHNRIDPMYCSDGPLLMHTMCQHIHHNHLAFVKTIKN
jgi:hypothetical protein